MGSIMVMRGCMYSPGEALAKARDPKMTTKDNPLFSGRMTSDARNSEPKRTNNPVSIKDAITGLKYVPTK